MGNKTTLFNINPIIGYQFNDHLQSGIGFGYNQNKVYLRILSLQPLQTVSILIRVGPFFARWSESISSLFGAY